MSVPLSQRTSLRFSELNQHGHIPTREIARSIATNQSLNDVKVDEELTIANKRLVLDAIHGSTTIESLTFYFVNPMDVGLRVNQMRKLERLCFVGIESARASDTLTSLQFNRNVQEMIIMGGNIGDSVAYALARSIRFRGCLMRQICFSRCGLTSNGIAAVGLALQPHSLLKQVEISEVGLVVEAEAAAVFARGIEMNTSVEDLMLSVKEVPTLESKLILHAVVMFKYVEFSVNETISRSGRNLYVSLKAGNRYVPPVVGGLAVNQSLRTFVVGTGIDAARFDLVCDALVQNDTMENLELRCRRQITPEMILSMGRMLSNNSTLKSLFAHGCGINDDMAIALFESLTPNQSLDSLILTRNVIGNRGAASIAAYVSTNQTCKKLDLRGNNIGDVGFVALGNALKRNTSLETLYLSKRHYVTERGVRAVLDGVKDHHVIKNVNIVSLSNVSHQDELDFYLERNKVAKPLLDANLPLSIWPRVLKRAHDCRHVDNRLRAPDMLFHFVKEKCDLFRRHPSNRKRKRGTNA